MFAKIEIALRGKAALTIQMLGTGIGRIIVIVTLREYQRGFAVVGYLLHQ
jgi:hypothetical protein